MFKKTIFAVSFLICAIWAFGGHKTTPLSSKASVWVSVDSLLPPIDQPVELGQVHWLRDLDAARSIAQKAGKPILALFQEVPGCSNCTRYGQNTLSHPLIVEAIETFFVPLCVYNNKGGKDADALRLFGEPAWNNPVVRILKPDLKDLVPRIDNFNSSAQLANGMHRALELWGVPVPHYLELAEQELSARESGLQAATFSMYCFWSGEAILGRLPGVMETEPGFQDGKEVVRVYFAPTLTSRARLEQEVRPKQISLCSKNQGFRPDNEPKHYLSHSAYRKLQLTSLQATRINSALAPNSNDNPDAFLSPRQLKALKK